MKLLKVLFVFICILGGCITEDSLNKVTFEQSSGNPFGALIIQRGNGDECNAFPMLVPRCLPAYNQVINTPPPEYMAKQFVIEDMSISARQMLKMLELKSGIKIIVEGGVPSDKTSNWDGNLISLKKGKYTYDYLLQKLISYMQEVGIPSKKRDLWNKNVMTKHRVIAQLCDNKVIIRMLIIGEYEH